ncbi:MAG: alpha/beta fold hydrolase [Pirellulaceae bacterium]
MKQISIANGSVLNVHDEGRGPILLLVHGFPLDHSMWDGQIAGLADRFRVIAPDLSGFGRSTFRTDFDQQSPVTTMETFADELAALLDALQVQQKISLCGLSMGGYIAWQFWRRHRRRLDKLIVCDTRAGADPPEVARGRQLMAQRVLEEGAAPVAETMRPKLFADATHNRSPAIVAQTVQVMLDTSPLAIAAAQNGMAQRPDVTSWLPQIDVPTLVLVGQSDVISPVAEMRDIAAAIPRAAFVEIAGAGHMAPLEDPAAVNAAIAAHCAG